ncbi:MAG: CPBP family intramembrane glutamic endopeptidase [Candidatus Omnitrophota bacterium]
MRKAPFKDIYYGFIKFIKREPLYMGLLAFIILINLLTLIPSEKRDAIKKMPKRMTKAEEFIDNRAQIERVIAEDPKKATAVSMVVATLALVLFAGLMLDFVILMLRSEKRKILERTHKTPKVKWDIWDAVKVLILFFFYAYIVAILALLILPLFPKVGATDRIVSILNTTILDLIGIGCVFYFVIYRYKHKIKDLGLSMKNFFKNISYGFMGYLAVLPLLFVTLLITALILSLLKRAPEPQPIFDLFLSEDKMPVLAYLSIFVAIAGPVLEEIFFRGFLYTAIKKKTGIKWAILISAFIFSFLHAHLAGFVPIMILGVFLAYLYEKTGSLVVPMTVHVTHNLIMVFLMFLVKRLAV